MDGICGNQVIEIQAEMYIIMATVNSGTLVLQYSYGAKGQGQRGI